MNQVIDTILRRRSWRSYEEKQITQEQLDQVLECGLWAPSAKNEQSWHFTVLQNKELIAQLTTGCQQMMGSETDPFYGAPTLILVTGKEDCIAPMKDGSLAMQNMFLAAESLGLGTCWINCIGRYLTTPQGQEFGARVDFVESPVLVLSSTQVRAGDGGELLPPDVGEYIRQHGLYQFGELDALRQAVRSRQSAKRWQHTQGVEQAAAQLARLYGEEEQAARMAAILHDVTKGLTLADQLKLCRQYDIVTNYGENQVKLLHADTGAAVARAEFGADERVCQAIARHTTGAPGMTRLDAILYLADMIEPGRDYPGVEHLRQLCQQDLTQALILGLEQSMEHVRCGGCAPHGRTQETLNQLREKKEIER